MAVDASAMLRILNNERLRSAQSFAEFHDLGGAVAKLSDAPIADLNCIESFQTTERALEGLLDIGFSLLRAFDREPAAYLTPLDRPKSLRKRLKARGLRVASESVTLTLPAGAAASTSAAADVEVRVADPDDAQTYATIHSGGERWVKRASRSAFLDHVRDPSNRFYLGCAGAEAVGTTQLLMDGSCAGIYGVSTVRAHRGKGVATALLLRAIADARAAGCDIIFLRTVASSEARRLYERLGFEEGFTTETWAARL